MVSLVMAVLFVLAAADAIRYAVQHSGARGGQWLLAAALLVAAVYLILVSRTRVVVTAGAPTFLIKNVLRTHEVAWSEVDSIDERRAILGGGPYGGGRSWVILVRLRDGRSIRCSALSGIGQTPLSLRRELESMRAGQSAGATG
jgi:hypothetical protein